ncbi:hypothetical protein C8R43DRAFT_965400 [Mycena crocata]|nr:hypothetical protein C8R43DRAFT_965400 [Mycena crocata]
MSPAPDMEPRLPVELEREIFELAAWAHLRSLPSLLLDQNLRSARVCGGSTLPLKTLFCPAAIDLSHPLFVRLTHLCLDTCDLYLTDRMSGASLAALPCLTHLAFTLSGSDPQEIMAEALMHCVGLSVLVLLRLHILHITSSISPALARDKRFVQLLVEDFIEDWQAEVMGKDGYWGRAEAIVQQRQSLDRNDLAGRPQDLSCLGHRLASFVGFRIRPLTVASSHPLLFFSLLPRSDPCLPLASVSLPSRSSTRGIRLTIQLLPASRRTEANLKL